MNANYLPVNRCIYPGLRETDNGNAGYTYGLKEFGKTEMEILNSGKSLEDIRAFLFNIAHYVIGYDFTFKDGQTVGGSEEEKIPITLSKGKLVETDTFKLTYWVKSGALKAITSHSQRNNSLFGTIICEKVKEE